MGFAHTGKLRMMRKARIRSNGCKSMSAASAIWKPIAFVGAAVGLKEAVSWFHKELPELVAFPIQDLIRDENWKEALALLPAYKKLKEIAQNFLRGTGFEAWLGFPIWQGYADGMDAQLATWEAQIAAGLETVEPETTISVSTNVDPAGVTIAGIPTDFVTPFTVSIPAGSYDVTAEKEGYAPRTKTAIVKKGENNIVSFELEEIPPDITPRAGRLQVTIYDKKTGAITRGTLFVNNRAEQYHLHTYVLDLAEDTYEIRVEEPTYKIYEDTVSVTEGETTAIRVELEKVEPPPPEPEPEPTPEPEPEPEPIEKGRLEISSTPSAQIWIAGEKVAEKTPVALTLTQGYYDITFKAKGYVSLTRPAILRAGETTSLSATLTKTEEPPAKRKLWQIDVNSNPTGAKILINGSFTNRYTPDYVLLEPGEYMVGVTKTGYKPASKPIILEEIESA